MSLFQFGFLPVSHNSTSCSQDCRTSVPAHMPTLEESGLGVVEYDLIVSTVSELSDPGTRKKRQKRGTYTHYKGKDRARIGKFALENGTVRAVKHFSSEFPGLKESTVRNFKTAYKEQLAYQ